MHLAAEQGHKDVVKLLLAHKAKVNATDNYGGTPLYRVSDYQDISELLRQHGGHE